MKIKQGFVLKKVAENFIVVPTGAVSVDFSGMISLNESGVFLWKLLENNIDVATITNEMLKEYNVDRETARADIESFISKLDKAGLLE